MTNSDQFEDCSSPPFWFKSMSTLIILIGWYLISEYYFTSSSLQASTNTLFLTLVFFVFAIPSAILLIAIWVFPKSKITQFTFLSIRFARDLIGLLALCGILFVFMEGYSIPKLHELAFYILLVTVLMIAVLTPLKKVFPYTNTFWARILSVPHRLVQTIKPGPKWLLGITISILPIALVSAIIYFDFEVSFSDYQPYAINDETGYWIWVRSFSQFGFNSGYNVPSEKPALAAFNHYGEGSPLFVFFYGTIGMLVGWVPQLPILINFIVLSSALLFFIRSLNLDFVQILFAGLVVLLFWPISLFLATTFQETFNQSIGIVMSVALFMLLNKKKVPIYIRYLFVLFVFIAALIRLSWAFLLFPMLFLSFDRNLFERFIITILIGSALFISTIVITNYLVPPENNSIFETIRQYNSSGIRILFERFLSQLKYLIGHSRATSHFIIVFEFIIIITYGIKHLIIVALKKAPFQTLLHGGSIFDIFNLLSLLFTGLTFYLVNGFTRTFTPSLLVSTFLLIARKEYKVLSALLIINLLFFPYFFHEMYAPIKYNFTADLSELTNSKELISKFINYDDESENPWCNTLLVPLERYDYRLTIIPPGIGVSFIDNSKPIEFPLKSKYLLLDRETLNNIRDKLNVKRLASLQIGMLLYNIDSGCELK